MPLPDKHADETSVELNPTKWALYQQYMQNHKYWLKLAVELKGELVTDIGDASAGLVAGQRVVTYRPTTTYAAVRMKADHPSLAQHYMHEVRTDVFDVELFAKAYPEIAEKYRVRQFREEGE